MARTPELVKYVKTSLKKHGITTKVLQNNSHTTLVSMKKDGFLYEYEVRNQTANWDSYITFLRAAFSAQQIRKENNQSEDVVLV